MPVVVLLKRSIIKNKYDKIEFFKKKEILLTASVVNGRLSKQLANV